MPKFKRITPGELNTLVMMQGVDMVDYTILQLREFLFSYWGNKVGLASPPYYTHCPSSSKIGHLLMDRLYFSPEAKEQTIEILKILKKLYWTERFPDPDKTSWSGLVDQRSGSVLRLVGRYELGVIFENGLYEAVPHLMMGHYTEILELLECTNPTALVFAVRHFKELTPHGKKRVVQQLEIYSKAFPNNKSRRELLETFRGF